MNRLIGRYPRLNRGLVLLVTLLLPPTTAAAVLHALACERIALVAAQNIETRPGTEAPTLVADEEENENETEPTAPVVAAAVPSAPVIFTSSLLGEALKLPPVPPNALRATLARRSAPRAPPA